MLHITHRRARDVFGTWLQIIASEKKTAQNGDIKFRRGSSGISHESNKSHTNRHVILVDAHNRMKENKHGRNGREVLGRLSMLDLCYFLLGRLRAMAQLR